MLACGRADRMLGSWFSWKPPKQRKTCPKEPPKRATSTAATAAEPMQLTKELRLVGAATCIPHPEKVETGGEDAYFVSTAGGGALGVADGVGGWAENGINPADYSKNFMRTVREFLEGKHDTSSTGSDLSNAQETPSPDLRSAFEAAHDATQYPGSCTACALKLESGSDEVVGLNLGDSGFMIIRDGKIVMKTEPMQHFFDCPCQFGAYPRFAEATDITSEAEEYLFKGKPGDCIVMGTDGLWDNVHDEDVVHIVSSRPGNIRELGEKLAKLAYENSLDEDYDSPYCIAARKEGYDLEWYEKLLNSRIVGWRLECGKFTGGKMDDITVVVGYIDSFPIDDKVVEA